MDKELEIGEPTKKNHTLVNPYSGTSQYYGKGRMTDVSLKTFSNKRETYWTDVGDKWLKVNEKDWSSKNE